MKLVIALVLLAGIGFGAYQVRIFLAEKNELKTALDALNAKEAALLKENEEVKKDIEYYSNEANLEKAARTELNFRGPDENMMVVVPKE